MELADLRKIGLTKGEIAIYSALLDLGESTRTKLTKKSGISPSKIYDVANRLLEKGIISTVKKNGIIHFSAADPEKLKEFIEQKEKDIETEKTLVDNILPMLISKYQKTEEESDIEVFYGWEGMKTAFNDVVKSLGKGDENCILGASLGKNPKQADIFFSQYYNLVDKKGYKQRIIFNSNVKENKERISHFYKFPHEIRFIDQETYTEISLYKDKVLVILLLSKPIVIRIKNKEAANSFKQFFESIWKISKL